MPGLGGFIVGLGALVVSFLMFVLAGIYHLAANDPNMKVLTAAFAAFATMLVFGVLVYVDDMGWIDFRSSLYNVLAPLFIFLSILAAIVAYATT